MATSSTVAPYHTASGNELEVLVPKLIAQSLPVLRNACVMPRLVNLDIGRTGQTMGSTINVPITSETEVKDVVTGINPPASTGITPDNAVIKLDQWKEASFTLSDDDFTSIHNNVLPEQTRSAIVALAEYINKSLLSLYKGVWGYVGSATIPAFQTASDDKTATPAVVIDAAKELHLQKAPVSNRKLVINPVAQANASALRALQDRSWNPNADVAAEGMISKSFGFEWYMDQQVETHTSPVGQLAEAKHYTATGSANTVGKKTVNLAGVGTPGAAFVVGDAFSFAGHANEKYAVTDVTGTTTATTSVEVQPALRRTIAAATKLNVLGTHVANIAFHRDAFAFASRPLQNASIANNLGNIVQEVSDPMSGLSIRLEVERQNKQTQFTFDVLFGMAVVRPDLAVRVISSQ